ncbi:phage tail-collar fiber domain-containing protein [Escherichia coli]|uniref:phage tail-collar fiber domain-containing protein n=2 Tax=Escherichia coli TaxID=562 RepID=UPI0002CC2761|nr:phage tail protein [Escherichia coli]EFH3243613.1 phage tail protein [Escherichia coli]EMU79618.1 phage tail fiber repeat family protein [Escherichia coli MP021017.9]EMU81598.1 phage tail fiber repeat family protein [Escherichia coli MP021017.6]EMU83867.1 phage tail fiber repeat family protein [Escherichia coli MP021017.5]EMU94771.1 phage tail fiber repeat family protein [Escherichia coli MP021017.4]
MTVKYYAILTNQGAARLANATMLGSKLNLTQMAVGDANGVLPTPDPAQTKLINQKRIAPLNLLSVDPNNQSQIIAEQIIPENEGGFWIREIGLYDDEGVLIAVANCPETYKPQLQEGSGRTQTIRMILVVSNTEAITLKIDPSVVLATRQYVDQQIEVHEQSRRHPSASLTEKGFVRLYSGVESNDETVAATPKAVKIAMDNASARLAKDRNGSDIPNPALFVQNLGLKTTVDKAASAIQPGDYGIGLAYLKTMGTKSQFFAYSTAVGYPEVPTHGAGFQACYNDNRRAQIYVANDGKMYCRFSMLSKIADDETPWNQVFTSAHYPEASVSVKGMVQLGSDVNSVSENVAATLKAVKIAMDNASARLAKDRNGADIPDPTLFIQNLGLKPTVDKAESALQQGAYGIGSKNNYEMGEVSQFLAYSGNADEVPSNGAGFQAAYNKNRRAQIFITGAGEMYHRFSGSDTVKDNTTLWRRGVCEDEFSFGSNYHRITGGVLKQFFNSYFSGATGVVNKEYQVNFPTPFARQCWYVIPVFRSSHGGSVEGVAITAITATGFTLSITGDNGGWNIGFIAEGV